jgi:hypothetical protein
MDVQRQVAETGLVGIHGGPCADVAVLRSQYRRLISLLPWVLTVFEPGSLVEPAQVSVYGLLGAATAEDREAFVAEAIGGLFALSVGARDRLLETIEALFETGSPEVAAEVLHVHPKTIQYRMTRVTEVTGLSWRRPADRIRLDLAMHLHHLSSNEKRIQTRGPRFSSGGSGRRQLQA